MYNMVANNPYDAYQKFAKKPITKSVEQAKQKNTEQKTIKPVSAVNSSLQGTQAGANAVNHYAQNAVFTATPEELVLMLYKGALKFINQAIAYMEEKNIEKTHQTLIKAQNIFYELSASLDMKYDISDNLQSIYTYIIEGLGQANIEKSQEKLREIVPYIKDLRDTWSEAMKISKKEMGK